MSSADKEDNPSRRLFHQNVETAPKSDDHGTKKMPPESTNPNSNPPNEDMNLTAATNWIPYDQNIQHYQYMNPMITNVPQYYNPTMTSSQNLVTPSTASAHASKFTYTGTNKNYPTAINTAHGQLWSYPQTNVQSPFHQMYYLQNTVTPQLKPAAIFNAPDSSPQLFASQPIPPSEGAKKPETSQVHHCDTSFVPSPTSTPKTPTTKEQTEMKPYSNALHETTSSDSWTTLKDTDKPYSTLVQNTPKRRKKDHYATYLETPETNPTDTQSETIVEGEDLCTSLTDSALNYQEPSLVDLYQSVTSTQSPSPSGRLQSKISSSEKRKSLHSKIDDIYSSPYDVVNTCDKRSTYIVPGPSLPEHVNQKLSQASGQPYHPESEKKQDT